MRARAIALFLIPTLYVYTYTLHCMRIHNYMAVSCQTRRSLTLYMVHNVITLLVILQWECGTMSTVCQNCSS